MASLGLIGLAGGVGNALIKEADEGRKMAGIKDLETWRLGILNELKMQDEGRTEKRTIAAEQRKVEMADKLRVDQVGRIDRKVGELTDTAVAGKRGLVDSAIVDREAWTPEQQSAVDQSLALDRSAITTDPKTRTQAAMATGDISPKDAATLGVKDDTLLYKTLWEQSKEDGRNKRSDDRIAASAEASDKRLDAMLTRIRNGDTVKAASEERKQWTTLFSETGRRLTEARKALTTLQKSAMYSMAEQGSPQAKELDDLRAEINRYTEDRNRYGTLLAGSQTPEERSHSPAPRANGDNPSPWIDPEAQAEQRSIIEAELKRARASNSPDVPSLERELARLPEASSAAAARQASSAPAGAKPMRLPAGAVQIGTSGGKPVYQTPDGKRFVVQ